MSSYNINQKGLVHIILLFIVILAGAFLFRYLPLFLQLPVRAVSLPGYQNSGWDPGIFKRCARSAPPGSVGVDYYDGTNCGSDGKYWQIGFQSESSYTSGGCNRFNLTDPNTPINLNWVRRADNGWMAQIVSDFANKTHPCGANYFNWVVFMDQLPYSQTYPRPDKLATFYKLWYDSSLPSGTNGGASRVILGWQGFWDGKSREIEMSVYLEGWGDNSSDSRIVATLNRPDLQYVHIDGAPYNLTIPKGQDKELLVDWSYVINNLIDNGGYLDRPTNWVQTATSGVWAGVETNNKLATSSIASNLYIKDLTILDASAASPTPSPSLTPNPLVINPAPNQSADQIRRVSADFNGDSKADIAVWQLESNGLGYFQIKGQGSVQWGKKGDIPVPADYNGDGKADMAVWRPDEGVWYIKDIGNVSWGSGEKGDTPIPADYNGDGKADIAVYRPSEQMWFIKDVANTGFSRSGPGRIPVVADYNGDRKADIAVWDSSDGKWYIKDQVDGLSWGRSGDVPVPTDYTGDGKADIAVWQLDGGRGYFQVKDTLSTQWGRSGDIPLVGDYDGDGKKDPGVWQLEGDNLGYFQVKGVIGTQWGRKGDIPL